MPRFSDANLNIKFSFNLAFTQDKFLNRPHCDTDASATAFILLTNVDKKDGLIALNLDPTFMGPFLFFLIIKWQLTCKN
jgi:hypothetical protein